MEENQKMQKKVDNSVYRERFQFQLSVNGNIIVQRYFRINHFNPESLSSQELYQVLDGYRGYKQEIFEYLEKDEKQPGVVQLIQRDLESKSRIYLANSLGTTTKLTGFKTKADAYKKAIEEGYDEDFRRTIVNRTEIDETRVTNIGKEWDDTEFIEPWDVTFKFSFLVDEKPVFSRIWDGSNYPKYVRNSVDLSNSWSQFPMVQLMNADKANIISEIIKRITNVCSNPEDGERKTYTKSVRYGNDETFAKASKTVNRDNTVNVWSNVDGVLKVVRTVEPTYYKPKSVTEDESYKHRYTSYNRDYVQGMIKWHSQINNNR